MRRVFLADAHQPVRSALRLLLEHEPDLAVVGEADEVEQVIAAVGAANPDLVLLEWHFVPPAGRGLIASPRQAGRAARGVPMTCRPEHRLRAAPPRPGRLASRRAAPRGGAPLGGGSPASR